MLFSENLEQKVISKFPSFECDISEDFIGIFDGLFSKEYCQKWIDHFEKLNDTGMVLPRNILSSKKSSITKDSVVHYKNSTFYANKEMRIECGEFNDSFWNVCYGLYAEKYSLISSQTGPHRIYNINIQRTAPGEGYHVWHYESSAREVSNRLLVFILYLNDIKDGGETEFLYCKKRVNPKEGRLLLFPAGFTHAHRGNPPLKENKYIITGWVEL